MTEVARAGSLARPAPPENPYLARDGGQGTQGNEMGIESTIRCSKEGTHLTPLPGRLSRRFSSKRNACSIVIMVCDRAVLPVFAEAASKRRELAS